MLKNFINFLFVFCLALMNVNGQTNSHILNSANNSLVPDQVYFCSGENFNLKVNATATSTGDYTITKDSPTNFPLSAGTTPITFSTTGSNPNKFSKLINIGFNFSFYGQTYTQFVAGTNGRLIFSNSSELTNFSDNTTYKDRTFSGIPSSAGYSKLNSADYNKIYLTDITKQIPLAQIFFGYTDLYSSSTSSTVYNYKSITYNGLKGLLISYQNEIHTDGVGGISGVSFDSYVILLEDNRIIVYINNKTETSYNAILGIQNETATKFKVPQHSNTAFDYNNGKWASEGVAWIFTPSQNLNPKIDWFVNGTSVNVNPQPNNNFLNYSPQDTSGTGEKLEAKISFFDDTNTQVGSTETSSVLFYKLQKPQISDPTYGTCGNPAELHVINPNSKLTYDWYSTTDPTFHQTGTSINVGSGTYFVRVKNTAGTCNIDSDTKIVNIASVLPPFVYENQTVKVCDNLNQNSVSLNLTNYYPLGSNYSVEFYENGVLVPGNITTINSGQTKTFTIKVSTNAGVIPTCNFSKTFLVSYLSFPPNNIVYNAKKLCLATTNYTTTDFKNEFFASSNYDIKFSTDGINFTLDSVNPSTQNTVFVKLSNPNFSCTSSGTLNFSFHPDVVANTPNPNDPNLQQCASATQTFDLHTLFDAQVNSGNVTITYHTTLSGAQSGDNSIPNQSAFRSGMGNTTLYIRVVDNVTGCVAQTIPTVTLVVYLKPTILVQNPIVMKNCPQNTVFNLTQDISKLTNAQSSINVSAEYYAQNGTLLTSSQITNYDASVFGTKPYIQLKYNSTCGATIGFDLQYYPLIKTKISQITICTETSYTLSDFLNKIIDNQSNYTFTDENRNPLPNSFDLSTLPKVVKVIITDKTTGCKSDIQTVSFVSGNPTPTVSKTSYLETCDEVSNLFDGITGFNLDDAKNQISSDNIAVFEYFKDSSRTQKIGASYTNETAFSQTIYGKVTGSNLCPTNFVINLKVNSPTKSTSLKDKYFICYGDNLSINAGSENGKWEWSDGQNLQYGTFTKPGNYSVKLTNSKGCSYTHNFVISDENQPIIKQINQNNEQIEVIATGGIAPYQYSFDGGLTWQNSNILQNPKQSSYTIQVRSSNGCLGAPKSVYFIKINNVITPNGDGKNDFWTVENLGKMQNIDLKISDRFGKIVYDYAKIQSGITISPSPNTFSNDPIWDGTNNGRPLPTSSYWYAVKWFDPATNKEEIRQGWILLKNRE